MYLRRCLCLQIGHSNLANYSFYHSCPDSDLDLACPTSFRYIKIFQQNPLELLHEMSAVTKDKIKKSALISANTPWHNKCCDINRQCHKDVISLSKGPCVYRVWWKQGRLTPCKRSTNRQRRLTIMWCGMCFRAASLLRALNLASSAGVRLVEFEAIRAYHKKSSATHSSERWSFC